MFCRFVGLYLSSWKGWKCSFELGGSRLKKSGLWSQSFLSSCKTESTSDIENSAGSPFLFFDRLTSNCTAGLHLSRVMTKPLSSAYSSFVLNTGCG